MSLLSVHEACLPLPTTVSEAFPRSRRVRKGSDFRLIAKHGKRWAGTYLVLETFFWRDRNRPAQLGLKVSRKYGDAVTRNLFKRRIREIFRKEARLQGRAVAIIVAPRGAAAQASYEDLQRDFASLLLQAAIL